MAWTINGTSADSFGIDVATVDVGTGMVDRAILETSDDWDGTALAYGDWVSIAADGTVVLWGMVTSVEPYAQGGGRQGVRYEISGPGYHLEITPYTQPYYYATGGSTQSALPRSKCWLGVDPSTGNRCNTKQAIDIVLAVAVANGVPMTFSTDFTGVEAPPFEMTDGTISQALASVMRWHPGLVMFWRYTASSAVLHIKASLGAQNFACTDSGSVANVPLQVSVQRRDDMAPAGVVVRYERVNTFALPGDTSNVIQRIETQVDSAGTATPGPGVLMFTVEIKGAETQYGEQQLICRTVPNDVTSDPGSTARAKILKWYAAHIPAIAALPAAALEVEEHTRTMDLPEWNSDDDQRPSEWPEADGLRPYDDTAEPSELSRELVEGTVPEWTPWIRAEPMVCRIVLKWTGGGSPTTEQTELGKALFGEDLSGSRTFDVQYTGTNARTRRYKGVVKYSAPEAWPAAGLASAVYGSLSARQYEGRITAAGASSMTTLLPGTAITLTGGRTGSGVVQRVSFSAATRRTTVQFGAAGHLGVADFIELMRANRLNPWTANYAKERQQEAAPTSKGAITGNVRAPRHNVIGVNGGNGGGDHPFKAYVDRVGSAYRLRISAGTHNGVVPTLGGVLLDHSTPPFVAISGTAFLRVWMKVSAVLEFDGTGWFTGHSTPVATIHTGATLPDNLPAEGDWYLQIATVNDGVVTEQTLQHSIWSRICDAGGGNADYQAWIAG
jgi:hypothetical protein